MTPAASLTKVPFLRGLSDADRDLLAGRLVERSFHAGQAIFAKGDPGHVMFIIAKGEVLIFLPGEGAGPGRLDMNLRENVAGEHFGELALFDQQPRSASARAVVDTVLLELSREDFQDVLLGSRTATMTVLAEVAKLMRSTTNLLAQRAAKDTIQELRENRSWSERLADRVAQLNGSWTFIVSLLTLSVVWALGNTVLAHPFDRFPFVFFNLLLGLMVALQGPLIMMSQNRQSKQDRAQAASDFRVNLKNEVGIESLRRELGELRLELAARGVTPDSKH